MAANKISKIQNRPEQIKLREAAGQTWDNAQLLGIIQIFFTVGVPCVGAFVGIFVPAIKPFVGFAALLIALLDAAFLDRMQKRLLKRGARISEAFDTEVLELPWDDFMVGERVTPEVVHRASVAFQKRKTGRKLTDWYSDVSEAPMHLARLICQRANLTYDRSLRSAYATFVLVTAVALVAIPTLIALLTDWRVTSLLEAATSLFTAIATVTPAITWGLREHFRQKDAATALDDIAKALTKVWRDALSDNCGPENCLLKCREFQTAIFQRRASTPPILPGVYRNKRAQLEDEMNAAAMDFIAEYRKVVRPAGEGVA